MDPMQDMEMELDLRHYWAVIRRSMPLIIATTVLATLTALVVSLNMTPVYKATAQVRIQQASSPAAVDTYSEIIASERLARTYAKLMLARPILEQTLAKLGLQGAVDLDTLEENISATPVRDTTLIEISVEDTDPQRAILLANTIPEVFARHNESLQRSRFAESKRNLEEQLRALEEELATVQTQLAQLRQEENADPAEILRLEAQVTSLQTSYANLLRQFEEVRLAEAQAVDTIVLSEPAVDANRVRPRTFRNTLLAAIVGLMLGLGAAFLIEYLDDTVKVPDEIERRYRVPVLAGIPKSEESEDGTTHEHALVALHNGQSPSPVAEAFRVLRTNVQFASVDSDARTLMITSPEPVEGKSFTTANLAIVMSQMEQRVLVVDADLRKPRQHKLFGLPNTVGLTTALLAKEEELSLHVQETEVENLWVMTSGPKPPNPAELLGSRKMRELISALVQQWDVVLFDTPPILAATDAAVLSQYVGGVLVVCRSGVTRHPALEHALQELERVNARIYGVVLNALPSRRDGYHYYYYYRYYPYRYEYYSEDGQEPQRVRRHSRQRKGPLTLLKRAFQREG